MVHDATYLRVARQAGVRVDGGDVRADGSLVCKAKYDVHHTHLAAFLARKAAQRAADVSNSGGSFDWGGGGGGGGGGACGSRSSKSSTAGTTEEDEDKDEDEDEDEDEMGGGSG